MEDVLRLIRPAEAARSGNRRLTLKAIVSRLKLLREKAHPAQADGRQIEVVDQRGLRIVFESNPTGPYFSVLGAGTRRALCRGFTFASAWKPPAAFPQTRIFWSRRVSAGHTASHDWHARHPIAPPPGTGDMSGGAKAWP